MNGLSQSNCNGQLQCSLDNWLFVNNYVEFFGNMQYAFRDNLNLDSITTS